MQSSEGNGSTAPEDNGAQGRESGQDIWAELHRAQELASLVSSWGGNMFSLAWLELQLAMQSLPRMFGLMLALLPIGGLVWVTLSLLLAWFAYAATEIVAVGLGTLFGLQLLLLVLCVWQIKKLRDKSSFRETRQQWQLFLQELQLREQVDTREDHPGNSH